jgi:WD40-like Beta Propeller Repeat
LHFRHGFAVVDTASLSPKGNMLALAVGDWVETLSADGKREHIVYHGSLGSPDALTAPSWTPDGKRIKRWRLPAPARGSRA